MPIDKIKIIWALLFQKVGWGTLKRVGDRPLPPPPPKSAIDIPSYWAQYIIKYRNIQRNSVKQIYIYIFYIYTGVDVLSLVKIM